MLPYLKNRKVFLLNLLIISFACSNKHEKSKNQLLPFFLVNQALNSSVQTQLSQVTDQINYIPLETKSNNLITNITSIKSIDSLLYIEHEGKISIFNRKGKYYYDLFSIGRGPKECFCRCFDIDQDEKKIYVYDNFKHKINCYSSTGQFLYSFKSPCPNDFHLEKIIAWKNQLIFTSHLGSLIPSEFAIIYDINRKQIILNKKNPYSFKNNKRLKVVTSNLISTQKQKDKLLYKEKFNDTLFSVYNYLKDRAEYCINLGKMKRTYEQEIIINSFQKRIEKDSYTIEKFFDQNRFLFLSLYRLTKREIKKELCVIDKINGKIQFNHQNEIINDLDFGPNFKTFATLNNNWHKNELFYPLQSVDILNLNSATNHFGLKNIQEKLNENSNPVLMMIRIKD